MSTADGDRTSPSLRSPRQELADSTAHGEVYLRRLRRAQLQLSLLALVAFGAVFGVLPLALYLLLRLDHIHLLGVPLAIWILLVPVRFVRTTSDLLVASRTVTPWWNAAAISGEYLSAASFVGIAGLQLKVGASALWQSLGFTAGYLALLLFVAAPPRRFGSYTIPDFVEARVRSPSVRPLASAIVLLIGGFYLLHQLKGAGLALDVVTGAPYWVGVVLVAAIVAVNVAIGGMRGITYVQAFQFWVKVFAISVPACVLTSS